MANSEGLNQIDDDYGRLIIADERSNNDTEKIPGI
jgi:hypothetical protein